MKKVMLFLLSILVCSSAYAGGFKLGTEVSHITYQEKDLVINAKSLDVKESGIMYGVVGSFTSAENLYFKLDGKVSFGQVDYSGTGTINNIDDYMLEGRVLVGKVIKNKTFNLIPYTGFGYRFLEDDGSGKQTSDGSFSYLRQSNYQYLPIGFLFEKSFGAWRGDFTLEADALIGGHQTSRLDEIEIDGQKNLFPRLDNKQHTGGGFRASLNLSNKNVTFGPYVKLWKIQTSNSDNGFIEPKNTSIEVGGNVSIKF